MSSHPSPQSQLPKNDIKICPQPNIWAKVHRKLDALASKNGWAEPPVPLILAGWGFSSDEEKKQRWADTVDWCELNGCSDLILIPSDADWYMVFEQVEVGKNV